MSSKRSENRKSVHQGEAEGINIARWLNSSRRKPVLEVLQLIQRAVDAQGRENPRALDELGELLDSYGYHTVPVAGFRGIEFFHVFETGSAAEGLVLDKLLTLAELGLAHRLRICDGCGRWFFALRVDQHVHGHGERCRKLYRESEEYKAKHAAYMRAQYIPTKNQTHKREPHETTSARWRAAQAPSLKSSELVGRKR
jgi:hypothetical protein